VAALIKKVKDIQFGCFQFNAAQTSGEDEVKIILRRAILVSENIDA
jgi:hypothetical protein